MRPMRSAYRCWSPITTWLPRVTAVMFFLGDTLAQYRRTNVSLGRLEALLLGAPAGELTAARDLHRGFLPEEYEQQLRESLPADGMPRPVDLALFRRKQMLRIVLRDVLKYADLAENRSWLTAACACNFLASAAA